MSCEQPFAQCAIFLCVCVSVCVCAFVEVVILAHEDVDTHAPSHYIVDCWHGYVGPQPVAFACVCVSAEKQTVSVQSSAAAAAEAAKQKEIRTVFYIPQEMYDRMYRRARETERGHKVNLIIVSQFALI